MEHPDLESFPKHEIRNENSLIYTCNTVFSNKPFTDEEYYNGIQEKIAFLIFSLNKGHSFIDGNKRTIESIIMFFIEMNQDLFEEELVDDFFRGRLASFLVYMRVRYFINKQPVATAYFIICSVIISQCRPTTLPSSSLQSEKIFSAA